MDPHEGHRMVTFAFDIKSDEDMELALTVIFCVDCDKPLAALERIADVDMLVSEELKGTEESVELLRGDLEIAMRTILAEHGKAAKAEKAKFN